MPYVGRNLYLPCAKFESWRGSSEAHLCRNSCSKSNFVLFRPSVDHSDFTSNCKFQATSANTRALARSGNHTHHTQARTERTVCGDKGRDAQLTGRMSSSTEVNWRKSGGKEGKEREGEFGFQAAVKRRMVKRRRWVTTPLSIQLVTRA